MPSGTNTLNKEAMPHHNTQRRNTMMEFGLTEAELAKMARWEHDIYLDEAQDRNTRPIELAALAKDENTEIREAVAANPSTPFTTLARLIEDPDIGVRGEAWGNPSGPGPMERERRASTKALHPIEIARHIKKHLRKDFPGVKFSIRSTGDTGPIDIRWTDGPEEDSAEDCVNAALAALDPFKALDRPIHHYSLYRSKGEA